MKTQRPKKSRQMTRRNRICELCGNVEGQTEGWKMVHIWGRPYERGYAHGRLLNRELDEVFRIFPFVVAEEFDMTYSDYVEVSNRLIYPVVKRDFPEFFQEICGILRGYHSSSPSNKKRTVKELIAWNAFMSLYSVFKTTGAQRCSTFIATGSATVDGEIVMGHNTHSDYISGALFNIILKITPEDGGEFRMQTAAGLISSITDWFVCANGIIGCESTISLTSYLPEFGSPSFCRIRESMQYATDLDDFTKRMLNKNSGDYACSWLLGDTRTGEIMHFELGLHIHAIERTRDGFFYGMNSAVDFELRSLETDDDGNTNLSNSSGARSYRFHHLLSMQKIDVRRGKQILADHYDESLNKTQMGTKTICRHTEFDSTPGKNGLGFYPFGTHDAKIITSKMAKTQSFLGIWGSSCGRIFDPVAFVKKHPEYKKYAAYLPHFPKTRWVQL
jgi:hypothetical protein